MMCRACGACGRQQFQVGQSIIGLELRSRVEIFSIKEFTVQFRIQLKFNMFEIQINNKFYSFDSRKFIFCQKGRFLMRTIRKRH